MTTHARSISPISTVCTRPYWPAEQAARNGPDTNVSLAAPPRLRLGCLPVSNARTHRLVITPSAMQRSRLRGATKLALLLDHYLGQGTSCGSDLALLSESLVERSQVRSRHEINEGAHYEIEEEPYESKNDRFEQQARLRERINSVHESPDQIGLAQSGHAYSRDAEYRGPKQSHNKPGTPRHVHKAPMFGSREWPTMIAHKFLPRYRRGCDRDGEDAAPIEYRSPIPTDCENAWGQRAINKQKANGIDDTEPLKLVF